MRATILLPLAGLILLASCELPRSHRPGPDDMTATESFAALDRRVVFEVILAEIEREGLVVDRERTSELTGRFETHWVELLAPFRHEGIRKKLVGLLEEVPESPGRFRVRAITWVQKNAALKNPLDPAGAIWQDSAPDEGATELFLYHVARRFE